MILLNIFRLVRKCLGEARWGKYKAFDEKLEIFRILFVLHYNVEILKKTGEANLRIFNYKVVSPSYYELLYLFREIFIDQQYAFNFEEGHQLIVDCGANVGMATLFFKRMAPKSSVICFEPNPKAFHYLKRNIEENKLADVTLVNAGLSDVEGSINFFVDESNTLISSIEKNRAGRNELKVQSTTLTSYIQNRLVRFAKIDVEGAEWLIVNEIKRTNAIENIQEFAFEYHHNAGTSHTLAQFLMLLEESSFSYNLSALYSTPGQYQDILIRAYNTKVQ
jgi:FkbM family methyltransferase